MQQIPYRLITCLLCEGVEVCLLCGESPMLHEVSEHVLRSSFHAENFKNAVDSLQTASASPRDVFFSVDPGVSA